MVLNSNKWYTINKVSIFVRVSFLSTREEGNKRVTFSGAVDGLARQKNICPTTLKKKNLGFVNEIFKCDLYK